MLLERFLAQLLFELHTPSLLLAFVGISKARGEFCPLIFLISSLLIRIHKLLSYYLNPIVQKTRDDSGQSRNEHNWRNDNNVCDFLLCLAWTMSSPDSP